MNIKTYLSVGMAVCCCSLFQSSIAKPQMPEYANPGSGSSGFFDPKCAVQPANVRIKFLQRPLEADKGGVLRASTGGTAAHVHIIVEDASTGKMYENFGLTGSFTKTEKAKIFSEKSLAAYDKNPLGVVEMSFGDFLKAKEQTVNQAVYYSPLNNVDPVASTLMGTAVGGALSHSLTGIALGAEAGLNNAFTAYDKDGRNNYKIVDDPERQMCFPGLNCQSFVDMFLANARGMKSFVERKEYCQPGERQVNSSSESASGEIRLVSDGGDIKVDLSRLETILKKKISILEEIIARGKQATKAEINENNALSKDFASEIGRIAKQIDASSLSEQDKAALLTRELKKLDTLAEHLASLQKIAQARKLLEIGGVSGAVDLGKSNEGPSF